MGCGIEGGAVRGEEGDEEEEHLAQASFQAPGRGGGAVFGRSPPTLPMSGRAPRPSPRGVGSQGTPKKGIKEISKALFKMFPAFGRTHRGLGVPPPEGGGPGGPPPPRLPDPSAPPTSQSGGEEPTSRRSLIPPGIQGRGEAMGCIMRGGLGGRGRKGAVDSRHDTERSGGLSGGQQESHVGDCGL